MKYIKVVLSLLLSISLVGCHSQQGTKNDQEFLSYIDQLLPRLAEEEASIITLNISDLEKYGIEEREEDDYEFLDEKEFKESISHYQEYLEELKEFDYSSLTKEHQIIYDLLEFQYKDAIQSKDFYYLLYEPFHVNNGLHTQFPLYLLTIELKNEKDMKKYIKLLENIGDIFNKNIELEKNRQKHGYGMSSSYKEKVLEQINDFINADHHQIMEYSVQTILDIPFLSQKEKTRLMNQFQKIYQDNVLPAYKQLYKDLQSLNIETKDDYASLSDYQHGKAFYKQMVYQSTGLSIDELRDMLRRQILQSTQDIKEFVVNNPDVMKRVNNIQYTDLDNVYKQLQFFENKINESGDFPKIESLNYQMDIIPQELQSMFPFSAAYLVSPVDQKDANERMVLNGEFSQDDFTTLAHEGYPGHMYQNNYMKEQRFHILRYALSNDGYSEGWATYIESLVLDYAKDQQAAKLMNMNNELSSTLVMMLDIQIHYDDMSQEDALNYLKETLQLDEQTAFQQYMQLLTMPGIYLPYYGNYFQLKKLKETLDLDSELAFHKMYLDYSGLPITLIQKYELD